jgi:manganese/iron transport system substrate-binding protein
MKRSQPTIGLLAIVALLVACTPGQGASRPNSTGLEPVGVVTTTTVLADMARQVGGDRVDVHALVGAGGDVHTYDPAPSDAARLAGARLVLMNGLGLDDWLRDLAVDGGVDEASIVVLAENLDGVEYIEGGDEPEDDHAVEESHGAEEEGAFNPHLWLDISIARRYVERIADALSITDPARADLYAANAAAYGDRLEQLHTSIGERFAAIPAQDRRVVSFHDAFPYFAAAYDLEIVGVVVDAPGQEPSSGEIAELIQAVREADVRAILTESQFSDEVAQAVATETGVEVIHDLYTDSLGAPPLDTYEDAMRWNVEQIIGGLQ